MSKWFIVLVLTGLLLLTTGACLYELTPKSQLASACIEKLDNAYKHAPFVCPAIIERNTFHKGHSYSWDTVVYSGSGEDTTFSIEVTGATNPRPEYVSVEERLLELVTIQDQAIEGKGQASIIANFRPYEVKIFKVTLEIPKEADIPSEWEFRIRVKNVTQGGNVQVAIDQRCLINVKE